MEAPSPFPPPLPVPVSEWANSLHRGSIRVVSGPGQRIYALPTNTPCPPPTMGIRRLRGGCHHTLKFCICSRFFAAFLRGFFFCVQRFNFEGFAKLGRIWNHCTYPRAKLLPCETKTKFLQFQFDVLRHLFFGASKFHNLQYLLGGRCVS